MFNVSEQRDQLLVPDILLVKLDVVHGDPGGVDEGDGHQGGVESSEVQSYQQIQTRVNLDGLHLEIITLFFRLVGCLMFIF